MLPALHVSQHHVAGNSNRKQMCPFDMRHGFVGMHVESVSHVRTRPQPRDLHSRQLEPLAAYNSTPSRRQQYRSDYWLTKESSVCLVDPANPPAVQDRYISSAAAALPDMANNNENPWEDQASIGHPNMQIHGSTAAVQGQNPWQSQTEPAPHAYQPQDDGWQQGYAPPPGPPPNVTSRAPDETARFVPEGERGEQQEALQQFEMAKHQPQSQDDRNIETLTKQFPGIDSALVAAIYSDSQDMGASREM